ncbi:MAG: TdeIII family type II restriction endonuclease, partial [Bacteroidales bacterium]|nr:TdeIII family type II restriction endonuclease [Bacteroidales bacterium]
WAGIAYTNDKDLKVHSLIAIPYNPYHPEPYQFWTLAGMLDLKEELMVAERFWNFLGGEGAYDELLECFESAGIELRGEIDKYFSRFK